MCHNVSCEHFYINGIDRPIVTFKLQVKERK